MKPENDACQSGGFSFEAAAYAALAFDYEKTLAVDGRMSSRVVEALIDAASKNLPLVLVTGRYLDSLKKTGAPLNYSI
ncbi:MAG: hypothetical protein K8F91_27415 [Candidatus Obscuribacterales bacterium]|nr:hypothetical protein [Candidatus Obscuribacterales bacterium]